MSVLNLTSSFSSKGSRKLNLDRLVTHEADGFSWYAVIDGHGDRGQIVDWLQLNLHKYVLDALKGTKAPMETRLNSAFTYANRALSIQNKSGGASIVALLNWHKHIYLISLGDCKGVAYNGSTIVAQTTQHLAEDSNEKTRILASGGNITQTIWRTGPERLQGVISTTRGFGDVDLAKFGYIALPQVIKLPKVTSVILGSYSLFFNIPAENVYPLLMDGGMKKLFNSSRNDDNTSVMWIGVSDRKTDDIQQIEFDQPRMLNDSSQFPIANSMFFDERLDKEQSVYFNWWMQKRLEDWIYVIQLIMVLSDISIAGVQTVKFVISSLYNSPWEECADVHIPIPTDLNEPSQPVKQIMRSSIIEDAVLIPKKDPPMQWTRISEKFESVVVWRGLQINDSGKKVLYNSCWLLKDAVIQDSIDQNLPFKVYLEQHHEAAAKLYGKNGSDTAMKCFASAFNVVYEKLFRYMELRSKADKSAPDPLSSSLRISITAIRIIYPHFTVDSQTIERLKSLNPIITINEIEDLFGKGLIAKIDSFGIVKGVSNLVLLSMATQQLFEENNAEMCLRVAQFAK